MLLSVCFVVMNLAKAKQYRPKGYTLIEIVYKRLYDRGVPTQLSHFRFNGSKQSWHESFFRVIEASTWGM